MAKERPEKTEKKERKEKKEKRSETDGVKKSKSKKEKKVESKDVDMEEKEEKPRIIIPKEALVPFANPLADDKQMKKLLKSVKKAAKNKTLKRGVKEVVKSVRKLPAPSAPSSSTTSNPPGIVILAADISPMDVISHIPVLCEDHNIPYIYVTSRAELGAAGNTKRPTSVVMISKDKVKKAGAKEDKEGDQEYTEVYAELLKLVQKAGATLRI
ncbi:Ribonucleoside-diphosphate reductase small chain [Venturia inaequalis]|nr:Ribonucleoside-diphosphate reductase small chain [Venturia inaequalis]